MGSNKNSEKLSHWNTRINDLIKDKKIQALPEACKWYLYWRNKLLKENPNNYQTTYYEANTLISTVASLLNQENRKLVSTINKHRLGTKIRRQKIFSYLYTYEHYIHPLLIETQDLAQIKETINEITDYFETELFETANDLDEFQNMTLHRFIECMNHVMISNRLTELDILKRKNFDENQEQENFAEMMINVADYDFSHDRFYPALIMVCEALVTVLYWMCETYEVDVIKRLYYQPSQSFDKLEYTDWLSFLKRVGAIDLQELLDFTFLLNKWYQPKGAYVLDEVSGDIVDNALELVSNFINKQRI